MNDNYITIGELQSFATCTVWVGTDKATRTECTLSISREEGRYWTANLHMKVQREDLLAYIDRRITLQRLVQLRLPGSLIVQDVNRLCGTVKQQQYEHLPKQYGDMFDFDFVPRLCTDAKKIDEFLGITIKEC